MATSQGERAPRRVIVLGSTGSIGRNALDVISRFPERLEVVGLAAAQSADQLAEQIDRFLPQAAALASPEAGRRLRQTGALADRPLFTGPHALVQLVQAVEADVVLVAVVGAAGLAPTLAALEAGRRVALANKEALVAGGHLVMAKARQGAGQLVPVDSEHNALFQCLAGTRPEEVAALCLTASGGPFRLTPAAEFDRITPEAALKHPTWQMGPKVTIDSATLMNKGLEVIEARWLFGVEVDRIRVIVHPQSLVHAVVEFVDGSFRAGIGPNDMRAPIQHALLYPELAPGVATPLRITCMPPLTFEEPDEERFPSLALAREAARGEGTAPAVLNGANEVAVTAFLERRISFPDIPAVVREVLAAHESQREPDLDAVLAADAWSRTAAARAVERAPRPKGARVAKGGFR